MVAKQGTSRSPAPAKKTARALKASKPAEKNVRKEPRPYTLEHMAAEQVRLFREAEAAKTVRVTLYIHPKVHSAMRRLSLADGRDGKANSIYIDALKRYLDEIGHASYDEIIHGDGG